MGQHQTNENNNYDDPNQKEEDRKVNMHQRRTCIAKEIVETERTYVNCLENLYENWEKPLRDAIIEGDTVIRENDINTIFSISSGILNFHKEILINMEKRVDNWHEEQEIGDVFVQNFKALVLYKEYVNHYDDAIVTFKKCSKTKAFEAFASKRVTSQQHVDIVLPSLLIQPIQRIPRYRLLLEDMFNNTWASHPDYNALKISMEQIIKIAEFINQQKRKYEDIERLARIQNEIGMKYEVLGVNRMVLEEGEIFIDKIKKVKDGKEEKLRTEKIEEKREVKPEKEELMVLTKKKGIFTRGREFSFSRRNLEETKTPPRITESPSRLRNKIDPKSKLDSLIIGYCTTTDIFLLWSKSRSPEEETIVFLLAPLTILYYFESEDTLRITHETTRIYLIGKTDQLLKIAKSLESARQLASEVTMPHEDEHQILQLLNQLESEFKSTMTVGLTFRVVGHEIVKKGNYVLYHIEVVKRGEQKYVIKQRFKDILGDFHKIFGKRLGLDGPKKHKWEALMNGTDDKFIEKRKKELQDYLDELLKHMEREDMRNDTFTSFFQIPENETKK